MRKIYAHNIVTLLIGFSLLLTSVSCSSSSESGSTTATIPASEQEKSESRGHPPIIVTTCGMVTNIVKEVVGDKGWVRGMMGEGVDPHLYKPTRNDVSLLMHCDVVFYSGLMLEGRMADTFTAAARQGKKVYPVTEKIDKEYLLEPEEFEGHWDPHVWMDVTAWSQCVEYVSEALSEYDPPNADFYKQNAEAYRTKLTELDEYVKKTISSIPEEQRILITAHDAFGYFSQAYNIPVMSVQGISTESEAGVDDINRLVNSIVERKLKAIFVESSVSSKSIQAVIEGAEQKGWKVEIGGELFSDAMGKPGSYEGTYIGMIDHNATVIARALGGKAPEKGLYGKLKVNEKEE